MMVKVIIRGWVQFEWELTESLFPVLKQVSGKLADGYEIEIDQMPLERFVQIVCRRSPRSGEVIFDAEVENRMHRTLGNLMRLYLHNQQTGENERDPESIPEESRERERIMNLRQQFIYGDYIHLPPRMAPPQPVNVEDPSPEEITGPIDYNSLYPTDMRNWNLRGEIHVNFPGEVQRIEIGNMDLRSEVEEDEH